MTFTYTIDPTTFRYTVFADGVPVVIQDVKIGAPGTPNVPFDSVADATIYAEADVARLQAAYSTSTGT
jgi:hypothetical protein